MSDEPTRWSLEGFCDHFQFVHEKMPDHKFVWVLGAGASRASGVATGSQLVDRWLRELKLRLTKPEERKLPLEEWATAENLGIKGFKYDRAASFYPQVYERRFGEYPEEGYACLEDLMSGKDPSPGYSILAKALSDTAHRAVITTNFDNLIADALLIYTDTFPFVCGHESLASFVRVAMRRPLACKIHRDLLLGPKNDRRAVERLHEAWDAALRALMEHYTPIFIGYGGNDGSLMDLLYSLDAGEIKGQMIWCYYEKSKPSKRIKKLVSHHRGVLVPVPDFDLLMILLGERMGISLLHATILERAKKRIETYRLRLLDLNTAGHPSVAKTVAATFKRLGGWWAWESKARRETDPAERERVYRQGVKEYPKSHELLTNFAIFMTDVRKDHDEAEKLYRKALELDPTDANNPGNLGGFLVARGKIEAAGSVLRRAGELNEGEFDQLAAEIALYRAILARSDGRDDTAEMDRLAELFDRGFVRGKWSFDDVLEFARPHLSVEDRALYRALADAILDASKVDAAKELLTKRSKAAAPKAKEVAKRKGGVKKGVKKKAARKKTAKKKRS